MSHLDVNLTHENRIPVGDTPRGIAVAHGSVWITNERGDSVTRLTL